MVRCIAINARQRLDATSEFIVRRLTTRSTPFENVEDPPDFRPLLRRSVVEPRCEENSSRRFRVGIADERARTFHWNESNGFAEQSDRIERNAKSDTLVVSRGLHERRTIYLHRRYR